MIYRGYSYLHSRLLLYLQHEIACAEKELDLMDKDDFEDDTEDGGFYRKCLKSRDKDDVREGRPRRELLYKIKDLLLQYGKKHLSEETKRLMQLHMLTLQQMKFS